MSNAAELISSLKEYNNNSSIPISIPSQQLELPFNILTAKQHKQMLNTASKTDAPGEIVNIFNNVIIDTCPSDSTELLTTVDRPIILLCIRLHLFGNDFKIDDKTSIDILDHIKQKNKTPIKDDILSTSIEDENFNIKCKIPSILTDIDINNVLFDSIIKNKEHALGNLFIYEMIKYIESLRFGDVVYNFSDIDIKHRVEICELLPITLSNDISSYIARVKDVESSYLLTSTGAEISIDSILVPNETG